MTLSIRPATPVVNGAAAAARSVGREEPAVPDGRVLALVAGRPRLAAALASLVEDLRRAEPDDRAFVLGHLEALAARFGE